MARTAFWCERSAHSSASSRLTPAIRAALSPTPLAVLNGGASSVSRFAAGSHISPIFVVAGAVDIDSTPPPMPASIIPAAMFAAIHWVPAMPEAHQRWVATPGTLVMPSWLAA
ncbi:MAG: hypothetical protein V9E94_03935 [Microthrixaceae bacterium]